MANNNNYLEIYIGDVRIEVTDPEALPFTIDYQLEDDGDFQVKKGSESVSVVIPATLVNSKAANGFEEIGAEDSTDGELFKGFQPVRITHNGYELLTGKALLTQSGEDDKPIDYTFDFYGNNNDWIISLKESTLWDFLKPLSIVFSKQQIIDSWQFDGTDESLPYVFAPVRYGQPMSEGPSSLIEQNPTPISDYNMLPEYMKPSLSKYWLIYWGFKSLGYRVQSEFMNTAFFRRQVMPWTFGTFLFSDGTRLQNLYFVAQGIADISKSDADYHDYWDLAVTQDAKDGAFDTNNVYTYDADDKAMTWTYLPQFNYGKLNGTFSLELDVTATANSKSRVRIHADWFKNNQLLESHSLVDLSSPAVGRGREDVGLKEDSITINDLLPGDIITCKILLDLFDTNFGTAAIRAKVTSFKLDQLVVPLGGTVFLENFDSLKDYKFLDFMRGVVDEFNLNIATDPISKVVYMEPTHSYQLPGETINRHGFFNGDFVDWHAKQDISKRSNRILYNDSEKEFRFTYKDDSSDGLLKKIQDRYSSTVSYAKYILPDRFKEGNKPYENRFFSPTMHYSVDQWAKITGTAPQMVAIVPENISNTSSDESQNTFQPKSCYYKGVVNGVGWMFDGAPQSSFPYMFSVNYMPGGEYDPVLSYSDERIGAVKTGKVASGLFKRFFMQRMAIMRNGEWYDTHFLLNNYDVAGELHREFKVCRNQYWELISISDYSPLKSESTAVTLRRWVPISYEDLSKTFPTKNSVLNDISKQDGDLKYVPLLALSSDLPK